MYLSNICQLGKLQNNKLHYVNYHTKFINLQNWTVDGFAYAQNLQQICYIFTEEKHYCKTFLFW